MLVQSSSGMADLHLFIHAVPLVSTTPWVRAHNIPLVAATLRITTWFPLLHEYERTMLRCGPPCSRNSTSTSVQHYQYLFLSSLYKSALHFSLSDFLFISILTLSLLYHQWHPSFLYIDSSWPCISVSLQHYVSGLNFSFFLSRKPAIWWTLIYFNLPILTKLLFASTFFLLWSPL